MKWALIGLAIYLGFNGLIIGWALWLNAKWMREAASTARGDRERGVEIQPIPRGERS